MSKSNETAHRTVHDEPATGILLVNKPKNKTSFSLVNILRRLLKVKKIGHAGTLDPFATGVMVMLIGKQYTKLSNVFLGADKEYTAVLHLGIETDSYDCDGKVIATNSIVPQVSEIEKVLEGFQGVVMQTPPMFSAKKKGGKKLYELARKGITIEREPVSVTIKTTLLDYAYPRLTLSIECSKGTYVRSIAHDIGRLLKCGAHLIELTRTRSGQFHLSACVDGALLDRTDCLNDLIIKDLQDAYR